MDIQDKLPGSEYWNTWGREGKLRKSDKAQGITRLGATYFEAAFGNQSVLLDNAHRWLDSVKFDTMVGTGLSGSLVIPVLAHEFGCNFAIVRKEHSPHDPSLIVGRFGQRWLFVDDFVSSGETSQRVKYAVEQAFSYRGAKEDDLPKYVGTYTYEGSGYFMY